MLKRLMVMMVEVSFKRYPGEQVVLLAYSSFLLAKFDEHIIALS
jgi:hypothetical protein